MSVDPAAATPAPQITITPARALVDAPVRMQLAGFAPGQLVTVRARACDDLARQWASSATFQVDAHGTIDLSSQPPVSGSYDTPDPMGLFWSMALGPDEEISPFAKTTLNPTIVTFTAEVAGHSIAATQIERLCIADDVTRLPVRERGLVGTLFQPAGPGPHPAVMVLGGSEGGLNELRAALLASHGLAALALAYFALEQLPSELIEIPLEYFETAIQWLQAQDAVMQERLGVLGGSRGGELALLLAATFPQLRAVVATVPSNVVHSGFVASGTSVARSAWTYRGVPLPYLRHGFTPAEEAAMLSQEPIVSTPLFLRSLADRAAVEAAAIPVERINGPVLLISAQDDQMWPSARMASMVIARLAAHTHAYPYRHVSYPGAGHLIGVPYLPTTPIQLRHPVVGKLVASGGDATATAVARADAWAQTLAFLQESLVCPVSPIR